MLCKVVTASKSTGIGNGLTYETNLPITPGFPVRVPLRNRLVEGIVVEVMEKRAAEEYDLKQVQDILGEHPLLTEAQLKTIAWIADYYMCSLRSALGLWLPPAPWSKVLPQDRIGYRINGGEDVVRGKKQRAILEYLSGRPWASREELKSEVGASTAMLKILRDKKLIIEERRKEEMDDVIKPSITAMPALTPAQEIAYEAMKLDPRPSLLFGITGSGKTEIYAQFIAEAVKAGKQAILLVPEILLTEHSIDRFAALLPRDAISIIHSKVTESERRKEWKRIHRGEVALVIGSRSALFSPARNLGVVILDEEHEWTYKNEQTPRYHARDTAETLCRLSGAKLILGSATPSVESWAKTKNGTYHMGTLPQRYKEQALPNVTVIDLAHAKFGSLYPFTKPLLDAIGERLKRKEQSVLFLNRRGVASALLCLQCRRRVVSPESQLPFTLHHAPNGRPYLLDHTTGAMADVPAQCPHCKSADLLPVGAGTQKVEAILQKQFPQARLLRADRDTIQDPSEMRTLLSKMRKQEADILLGTQSVVKGLDLPHVTLAAVVLADVGLSLPHFRAGERIFQLLTQLTGRSGRARQGEVIIQTFRPDSPEVMLASRHETEKYLDAELKMRLYTGYPPASQMIRLLVRGDRPEPRAKKLQADALKAVAAAGSDIRVYAAPTFFSGNTVWHVLLRGAKPRDILASLDLTDVVVDVDPIETM